MTNRKYYFFLISAVSVLIISVVILFTAWVEGRPQPPAIEFLSTSYELYEGCPRDSVTYFSEMEINRPVVLEVTSSVLREHDASGDTVVFGKHVDLVIAPVPSERILFDQDGATFTIPDLPPGEYARVRAVGTWSEDSVPVQVIQPFTILESCE
jgi:hypothetical protein